MPTKVKVSLCGACGKQNQARKLKSTHKQMYTRTHCQVKWLVRKSDKCMLVQCNIKETYKSRRWHCLQIYLFKCVFAFVFSWLSVVELWQSKCANKVQKCIAQNVQKKENFNKWNTHKVPLVLRRRKENHFFIKGLNI